MIAKSFDKFSSQLDLDILLNFMRDSSSMLSSFKDKESELLLRFSNNRTIKLSSSDDSGSSDENRHKLESSDDSVQEVPEKAIAPNPMRDIMKKSILTNVRMKRNLKAQVLEEEIVSKKIQEKIQKSMQTSSAKSEANFNTSTS